MQPFHPPFVFSAGVLQVEEHRRDDERGVFGTPRLRRRPQHEIFEWRGAETRETGIDTRRVGSDERTLLDRGELQRAAGADAHPMHAGQAIDRQPGGSDQGPQLAGRDPAQHVHLEEAILRMNEASGAGDIRSSGSGNRRHTERVAVDDDVGAEAGNGEPPVDIGRLRLTWT